MGNRTITLTIDEAQEEELRAYLTQRRAALDKLVAQLGTGDAPEQTSLFPKSSMKSNGKVTPELLCTILRGHWLGNTAIRDELRNRSGIEIDRKVLRDLLKEGEDSLFKRRGEWRKTEWTAIQP